MADLTSDQAYRAAFEFLKKYFEMTGSEDIGSLLSGMQMLDDGVSADPAAIEDWRECVEFVRSRPEREAAE